MGLIGISMIVGQRIVLDGSAKFLCWNFKFQIAANARPKQINNMIVIVKRIRSQFNDNKLQGISI